MAETDQVRENHMRRKKIRLHCEVGFLVALFYFLQITENSHRTDKRYQNRIVFEFVTEDGNTPSTCTVRIGDKDPLTGEVITDMEFYLKEYYKVDERQVYVNVKNTRAPSTKAQLEEREKLKKKFIREKLGAEYRN